MSDPLQFSDRPQYVGQITDHAGYNPVFFSTRPTSEALKGIIHWFDPNQAYPDLRTIISYKTSTEANFVLSDVDSVLVHTASAQTARTNPSRSCPLPRKSAPGSPISACTIDRLVKRKT